LVQELQKVDQSITYRKVHLWERSGLIAPRRDTEKTGWRRFSFAEAVLLLMISDLRKMGITSELIRSALTQAAYSPLGVSFLNMFLISSIRGGRYVLLIDSSGRVTVPFGADGLLNHVQPQDSTGPVVCIHLYDYVRGLLKLGGVAVNFVSQPEPRKLSEKEEKLLTIIADEQYERIEVTKSNGEIATVRAVSRKRGKFSASDAAFLIESGDFRKVAATAKDGRIVTIETTDISKL